MNSEAGTTEPTPDDLQALMTRWLDCFVSAAREQDADKFKALFHAEAILFGTEKGGCVDWPLAIHFSFDRDHAKIFPVGKCCLGVVDWSMQPIIKGADVKRGHATFFCSLTKASRGSAFVCVHAHFSKF